jgi:lauroyl/myristoyl acyltransferase
MANFLNQSIPVLYAHIYQTALNFSNRHQGSPDALFKELWDYFQKLIKGSLFVELIESSSFGAYQLTINEYLSLQLTHALQTNGHDYSPELIGNIDDIKAHISKKKPVIIVSLHSGFFDTCKLLYEKISPEIKFSSIAVEPFASYAINKSRFVGTLNRIAVDKYCYIYLKKAIDNHEVVTMAIDYSNENENFFQFIDPSIFQFAKLNQMSLFFMRTEVLGNGLRELHFLEKHPSDSIDNDCNEFLKFVNNGQKFRRQLQIKKRVLSSA